MSSIFEQIRDSVSVVDYLRNKGYEVKQIGGGNQLYECPFCQGHDCFRIFANGKRWSCFQCGDNKIGKDVLDLEVYFNGNADYSSAIKTFANTLGLLYEDDGVSLTALNIKYEALLHFQSVLQGLGKTKEYNVVFRKENYKGTIWDYLTKLRLHSENCIENFKLGMSDGMLVENLLTKGYQLKEIRASGLSKNDRDLFKEGLIIYPQFVEGKLSHFTCKDPQRKLDPFQLEVRFRSNNWRFYNQDCLLDDEDSDKTVILVEGEDDLLSVVYKAGINKCIAQIGNLRDEQLSFLKSLVGRGWSILMAQDGDEQGKKYRNRILESVSGNIYDIPVNEFGIPEGRDIDDLLVDSNNPQEFFNIILQSVVLDPKLYKVSSLSITTPDKEVKKEELPVALEQERFLLRKLIRGDDLDIIFNRVIDDKIFFKNLHKQIFNSIRNLYEKRLSVNELVSYTMFRDSKIIKDDDEYSEIMLDIFSSDIISAIEIMEKKLKRRQMIGFSSLIEKNAKDESIEIDKVETKVSDGFFELFSGIELNSLEINTDNLLQIQLGNKETFKLLGCQYEDINACLTSGWTGGQIVILAGRTGMGKSTYKTNLKKHFITNKIGVIDFSPQNGVKLEQTRLDSLFTGISFATLWQRKVGDEFDEQCNAVHKMIVDKRYPLWQNQEMQKLDINYIVRKVRQYQKERPDIIDWVVFADLADKVKEFRPGKNQWAGVQTGLSLMRVYANLYNFCFVPVVQIGRGAEEEKKISKKRPSLKDLKGSGAWEEEPDLIFLLFREKYYDESLDTDIIEINMAKQRNGKTQTFEKQFIGDTCEIRNMNVSNFEQLPMDL